MEILREFKEKASAVGVSQFLIQTHFQTPLEVTPEAREAIRKILAAGWTITNQLVYNVAASRRGHTAKLRKVLNGLGVLCYYTFSVKGFEENYAVFAPNSRSLQEKEEEKVWGKLSAEQEKEFLNLLRNSKDRAAAVQRFCTFHQIPFVATDRSVLNLPGIGKSMTFVTIGRQKRENGYWNLTMTQPASIVRLFIRWKKYTSRKTSLSGNICCNCRKWARRKKNMPVCGNIWKEKQNTASPYIIIPIRDSGLQKSIVTCQ